MLAVGLLSQTTKTWQPGPMILAVKDAEEQPGRHRSGPMSDSIRFLSIFFIYIDRLPSVTPQYCLLSGGLRKSPACALWVSGLCALPPHKRGPEWKASHDFTQCSFWGSIPRNAFGRTEIKWHYGEVILLSLAFQLIDYACCAGRDVSGVCAVFAPALVDIQAKSYNRGDLKVFFVVDRKVSKTQHRKGFFFLHLKWWTWWHI